jgi:hypothetical protein
MTKSQILVMSEGYKVEIPRILNAEFHKEKFSIYLKDGRIITCTYERFPSLYEISLTKRRKFQILNEGIAINVFAASEVYHIRDFLGWPENWSDLS